MWDRTTFDEEGDLGAVELGLGVVFGVPVHLDGGEVLDGIVVNRLGVRLDVVFVMRKETCYGPSATLPLLDLILNSHRKSDLENRGKGGRELEMQEDIRYYQRCGDCYSRPVDCEYPIAQRAGAQ